MATQNLASDELQSRQRDDSEHSDSQVLDAIGVSDANDMNRVHLRIRKELIPKLGMEFETEDDAYQFYQAYAREVGFGTRISQGHKDSFSGKFLDRIFCCSREGKRSKDKRDYKVRIHRAETRCNCAAMIKINCRQTGKYRIVQFVAEHNHDFSHPSMVHMFRSHRKMMKVQEAQVDVAVTSAMTTRGKIELKANRFDQHEQIGCMEGDCKNQLHSKRSRHMRLGDGGRIMEHLQKMQLEDPNFFYAIQVDAEDSITNVFWADGKMKSDYAYFGDVVCFDTTYRIHNEGCPVALFVGVNHHKQASIFGVAFLYDETASTFEWLFDAFAGVMGRPPSTILTDTDEQMAKALNIKWPKAHHRLCSWQIYQHSATHLSGIFSGSEGFVKDFSSCLFDHEVEEDFIKAWKEMLDTYNLHDNIWLQNLFDSKEKWAVVYEREIFSADMGNIMRNESINIFMKKHISYKYDLSQFLQHFQKFLNDHRFKELNADFKASQSSPVCLLPIEILKHAAGVYTPEVFDQFKGEVCKAYDCRVNACGETYGTIEYRITPPPGKHYHHVVFYDSSSESISCSCKKFQFVGILCGHALKVLSLQCILKIPSQYILKRWTKSAKKGNMDVSSSTATTEPKALMGYRYKELCQLYVQLATKASQDDKAYKIAKDGFWRILQEVEGSLDARGTDDSTGSENKDNIRRVVKCSNSGERDMMESDRNQCNKRPITSSERAAKKANHDDGGVNLLESVVSYSAHNTFPSLGFLEH